MKRLLGYLLLMSMPVCQATVFPKLLFPGERMSKWVTPFTGYPGVDVPILGTIGKSLLCRALCRKQTSGREKIDVWVEVAGSIVFEFFVASNIYWATREHPKGCLIARAIACGYTRIFCFKDIA